LSKNGKISFAVAVIQEGEAVVPDKGMKKSKWIQEVFKEI
jgi:hypothetical protein